MELLTEYLALNLAGEHVGFGAGPRVRSPALLCAGCDLGQVF